jgi:hypothetical protein
MLKNRRKKIMFIPSNSHPFVVEELSREYHKELLQEAEKYRLLRQSKPEGQSTKWFQLPKLTLLIKQIAHFHPVLPANRYHR